MSSVKYKVNKWWQTVLTAFYVLFFATFRKRSSIPFEPCGSFVEKLKQAIKDGYTKVL